jgi:hypothetical protein
VSKLKGDVLLMDTLSSSHTIPLVVNFPKRSQDATTTKQTPAMYFFSFPTEIRLKIYSELLIHSGPIVIRLSDGAFYPLKKADLPHLCPEVLRVNKKVHSEASALLYSQNCFKFHDFERPDQSTAVYTYILRCLAQPVYLGDRTDFLHQIGSQMSLIRYICIPFPSYVQGFPRDRAKLNEVYLKRLERVRDTCKGITTLELYLGMVRYSYKQVFDTSPIGAEVLDILDTQFKTFPSLKEIIVNINAVVKIGENDVSENMIRMMRDRRWIVKPVAKKMYDSWMRAPTDLTRV